MKSQQNIILLVLPTLGIQAFDIPRLDEIDFSALRHLGLLSLVLVDHHNLFDPDLEGLATNTSCILLAF